MVQARMAMTDPRKRRGLLDIPEMAAVTPAAQAATAAGTAGTTPVRTTLPAGRTSLMDRFRNRNPRNPGAPVTPPTPTPTTAPVAGGTPAPTPPASPGTTTPAAPTNKTVAGLLDGLLSSDSRYIQLARQQGLRTGASRGLLNGSLSAGASEAAAIAAALPIASQDAQVYANKDQAILEGGISKENALALQSAQDKTAMDRLRASIASNEKLAANASADQKAALQAQIASDKEKLAASERQALLAAETSLQQSKIAANSNVTGSYLQALGSTMSNPELAPADRAKLIAEYQRVTNTGATYAAAATKVPLTYQKAA